MKICTSIRDILIVIIISGFSKLFSDLLFYSQIATQIKLRTDINKKVVQGYVEKLVLDWSSYVYAVYFLSSALFFYTIWYKSNFSFLISSQKLRTDTLILLSYLAMGLYVYIIIIPDPLILPVRPLLPLQVLRSVKLKTFNPQGIWQTHFRVCFISPFCGKASG